MCDYDVIVVGCGPAGLMAVAELKEKGINVLACTMHCSLTSFQAQGGNTVAPPSPKGSAALFPPELASSPSCQFLLLFTPGNGPMIF